MIAEMTGTPNLPAHHRNFFDAIRGKAKPNAPAEVGHLAASLCHLGNLATRFGRTLKFDPAAEQIVGDAEAAPLVRRQYRADHWATPKVV